MKINCGWKGKEEREKGWDRYRRIKQGGGEDEGMEKRQDKDSNETN